MAVREAGKFDAIKKYNQANLPQRLNNNFRQLKFPKHSSSLLARITPGQPREQPEESSQPRKLVV